MSRIITFYTPNRYHPKMKRMIYCGQCGGNAISQHDANCTVMTDIPPKENRGKILLFVKHGALK